MIADWFPPDLAPFQALSATQLIALATIYATTATVRGALGFGAVAPAIIFSSLFLEPHHAVLLALTTGTWAQAQIIPFGIKNGDWKLAKPLLAGGCVAIIVGVYVFKILAAAWLTVLLGLAMLAIALLDYFGALDKLGQRFNLNHPRVAFWLSAASGLLAGISGAGGMYLYSIYLKFACPTPTLFRGTSIMVGAFLLIWRFAATAAFGLISWRLVVESLLLLPISLLGAWAGIRFFHRADAKRFYNVFQIVLMLGALILLWKGFTRVS